MEWIIIVAEKQKNKKNWNMEFTWALSSKLEVGIWAQFCLVLRVVQLPDNFYLYKVVGHLPCI